MFLICYIYIYIYIYIGDEGLYFEWVKRNDCGEQFSHAVCNWLKRLFICFFNVIYIYIGDDVVCAFKNFILFHFISFYFILFHFISLYFI